MKFRAPVMRMSELVKTMGFPEAYLMGIYNTKGQNIARKVHPNKENSPIIFDTEGLEKWWNQNK